MFEASNGRYGRVLAQKLRSKVQVGAPLKRALLAPRMQPFWRVGLLLLFARTLGQPAAGDEQCSATGDCTMSATTSVKYALVGAQRCQESRKITAAD